MIVSNVFTDLPARLPDELTNTLLEAADVRIERIVSHGHASPPGFWYDQEEHEWVTVLAGAARVEFAEGEPRTMELGPGDTLQLDAHRRHRVAWTSPDEATIWLAVFYRS